MEGSQNECSPPLEEQLSRIADEVGLSEPEYREELLANCPPADANPFPAQIVLRLVPEDGVTAHDFRSQAALGRVCPRKADPCRWCGCSVFRAETRPEIIRDLVKLPNLSMMKFVAHVMVDEGSGKGKAGPRPDHITIWFYRAFDPLLAVCKVEPVR
jgi:hypothetical protein